MREVSQGSLSKKYTEYHSIGDGEYLVKLPYLKSRQELMLIVNLNVTYEGSMWWLKFEETERILSLIYNQFENDKDEVSLDVFHKNLIMITSTTDKTNSITIIIIKIVLLLVLGCGVLSFLGWLVYLILVWTNCINAKNDSQSYYADPNEDTDADDEEFKNGFKKMSKKPNR